MSRQPTDRQRNAVANVTLIRRRILALQAHLEEMRELEVAAIAAAVATGAPQTALVDATDLSKGRVSQMVSQGSQQPGEQRRELLKQWDEQWGEWPADRISDLARGARALRGGSAAPE